jgi:acyl-coenzyme A thioesterase PaaI-like protein
MQLWRNITVHKLQPNSHYCFVCGVSNPYGLNLKFYETAPGEVTVNHTVPEAYQGYPGVVHGGIVTAMLDEVLGRVHMGNDLEDTRFLFTARMTVHFRKPVPIGQPLRIVGRAVKNRKRAATSMAAIYGPEGDVLAEAEGLLIDVPDGVVDSVDLEALGWKVYPEESID